MRKALAVSIATVVATLAGTALGQGFDAHSFHPVASQRFGHLSITSGQVPDHLEWEAGGIFSYAHDVLVQRDFEGTVVQTPLRSLVTLDLLGTVGLTGNLEVGVGIPLHLASAGDAAAAGTTFIDPPGGAGFGDIRLVPKYRFVSTAHGNGAGIHIAGELAIVLPTGSTDAYRGGGFQLAPRVAAEWVSDGGSAIAVNVGYLLRNQAYFPNADLEVDDAILWGVGIEGRVHEDVSIVGDVHGEIGYASVTAGTEAHPIEALLGAEVRIGDALVNVGFGRGLSHGFAVPDFRFYVGASYGSSTNTDRDLDGLENRADRCPDEAEDLDGFQDGDGCPDPDDDEDGVLDRADRCDSEPEDMDGFEDGDGCPDPDNDGDGLLDGEDACPDDEEDIDLFEDADGCPEPDNDEDGVLDAVDRCPDRAEDVDDFEDSDGCPDPDNDEDGVLDAEDACPIDAEVINGVDDIDGCPEEGAIALDLQRLVVSVRTDVSWFVGIADDASPEARSALEELAVALLAYDDLRLRVVVRSADRAHLEGREGISVRRADSLRSILIAAGVPAERVETSSYGFPLDAPNQGYEVELRLVR